ncbi:MAG: HIT family protein [Erysipelotrichaceae bacterium]|jgi:histidine triad (HIT) family protein|nr:HIT family protein [Erysipelotrichaceae bacterium]
MCVFCKIINKEIPSTVVYEDEIALAILDIQPMTPGHTLVIPKQHFETLLDCDPEYLKEFIVRVQKVTGMVASKPDVLGTHLFVNNGEAAGQTVPHLHFHILPRRANDQLKEHAK